MQGCSYSAQGYLVCQKQKVQQESSTPLIKDHFSQLNSLFPQNLLGSLGFGTKEHFNQGVGGVNQNVVRKLILGSGDAKTRCSNCQVNANTCSTGNKCAVTCSCKVCNASGQVVNMPTQGQAISLNKSIKLNVCKGSNGRPMLSEQACKMGSFYECVVPANAQQPEEDIQQDANGGTQAVQQVASQPVQVVAQQPVQQQVVATQPVQQTVVATQPVQQPVETTIVSQPVQQVVTQQPVITSQPVQQVVATQQPLVATTEVVQPIAISEPFTNFYYDQPSFDSFFQKLI